MKNMLGLKELDLKKLKLLLDNKKLNLDAQEHQLDSAVAMKKADAEIHKASSETAQSFLDHVTAISQASTQQQQEVQKIEDAELRRTDLDAQAKALKSMGI
jgi:hypothetical protein